MSDALYLRLKSLNTRTVRGVTSPKNIIRVAAAHNLREIQAELGASAASGIDPTRTRLNYQLRGPATADEVAGLALALLDNAGVQSLRRDACMALELVFSIPAATTIDHREYFAAAVTWADGYFAVPILSASVHLDESAPHLHVLLLPLVAGRMQGGALAGGPAKIRAMLADFQQQVAQRFGITHQPRAKRLSKPNRDAAGRMVLDALRERPERLREPAMQDALIAALSSQAEALLALMGLSMATTKAKTKSFTEIMTAPCEPERTRRAVPNTKRIDIEQKLGGRECEKFDNVYLCVDVAPSPSSNPAYAQPLQPATTRSAGQRQQFATEIKVRAERKCGEMLRDSAARGERATQGGGANQHTRVSNDATPTATLSDIGITRDQSSRYQQLAAMPDDDFQTISLAQADAGSIPDTPATCDDQPDGKRRLGAGAGGQGHAYEIHTADTGLAPNAPSSAKRTKQPGDFQRQRDDDHPAATWCGGRGEFVAGPDPPRSASRLHS